MRTGSLEILVIIGLFENYVVGDDNGKTGLETPNEISSLSAKEDSVAPFKKIDADSPKNYDQHQRDTFWMSQLGHMRTGLINVQAILVKDENAKITCKPASRKAYKRHLMCAGSILTRYYVLTSATCIHEATHVRHNIRAPLSVVVSPLTRSIQVIRVARYRIHPQHKTNPYIKEHLTHNVAILMLACRISIDNFHQIALPNAPMKEVCSDENCVVAVIRKTGKSAYVITQITAPYIPFLSRRRKETSVMDVELERLWEYGKTGMIGGAIHLERPKRKLAEPPIFDWKYKSGKRFNNILPNSTIESTAENFKLETTTTISPEGKSSTTESSLYDDVSKILEGPSGNETIRSFVVRSSRNNKYCGQTGAPVMLNGTQAALVAIPCDNRQHLTKWYYTDIFNNVDWIRKIMEDWDAPAIISGISHGGMKPPETGSSGNSSGCSTCIFNFFIEVGCNEKNQCGKNRTGHQVVLTPNTMNNKSKNIIGGAREKSQDCSGSNSIGIELGVGQGCRKTNRESGNQREYRENSDKPDPQIGGAAIQKQTSLPNGAAVNVEQLEQPVTGGSVKSAVRNNIIDNSRLSGNPEIYKPPKSENSNRERVTNEIGLHYIDGDSTV